MRLGRGPCESRLGKQLREQDVAFRDILKHWANTTSKGETQTKKTQGQKTIFCSHKNDLLVPQTEKLIDFSFAMTTVSSDLTDHINYPVAGFG